VNTKVVEGGRGEGAPATGAGGGDHHGASISLQPMEYVVLEQLDIFRRNCDPWGIHTRGVPEGL